MNSNKSNRVPVPDRNLWVVWSTNALVAGIWGGVSGLFAITVSQMVAGIHAPGAFWGSETGQAVITLLVLFLIFGGCAVLVRKKYPGMGDAMESRIGIIISILAASVFTYTAVYVIFNEFFDLTISDHVFFIAMLFTVLFSIIAIPVVSAHILSRRNTGE
jgi:hypothetical protein